MTMHRHPGSEVVMYWNDAAWWAWLPMTLGMLLVWGIIGWIVVRALVTPGDGERPAPLTARDILDARLARGEITRDEYLDLRQVLESEHGAVEPERIGGAR
jgi:uncharacterized membrane protein